jgi:hypothetical protein
MPQNKEEPSERLCVDGTHMLSASSVVFLSPHTRGPECSLQALKLRWALRGTYTTTRRRGHHDDAGGTAHSTRKLCRQSANCIGREGEWLWYMPSPAPGESDSSDSKSGAQLLGLVIRTSSLVPPPPPHTHTQNLCLRIGNTRFNGPGYNEQNLAVCNYEFFLDIEALRKFCS